MSRQRIENKDDQIRALYRDGISIAQIARQLNLNYTYTYRRAQEMGLKKECAPMRDQVAALHGQGLTFGEIANRLNINYSYVHRLAGEAGLRSTRVCAVDETPDDFEARAAAQAKNRMVQLFNLGCDREQIAERLGVRPNYVTTVLKSRGIRVSDNADTNWTALAREVSEACDKYLAKRRATITYQWNRTENNISVASKGVPRE